MRIQRLQTRIIVFFVALLALVQVAAFWFVNAANSRNAQTKVAEELNVGQRVFARLLDQNAEKLKLSARVLASDFAFREAIATHDTGTIASALAITAPASAPTPWCSSISRARWCPIR